MKKIEKFEQFNEKFVAVGFGMPQASASWSTPARISYRDSAYDLAPIAGEIPDLSMGIAQQAHNYETNDNTQHTGDAYVNEAKGHINGAIDQAWSDKKNETKESKEVNEESAEKGLGAIPGVLAWDIEQFLKKQKDAKKLTKGSFTDLVQALHSRGFEDRLNGANLRNWQDVVKKHIKESNVNEEYVESMNHLVIDEALSEIEKAWSWWKNGPLTKPSDIRPAQKELKGLIDKWFKQNIK